MFSNLKKKLNSVLQGSVVLSESLQNQCLQRTSFTASGSSTVECSGQSDVKVSGSRAVPLSSGSEREVTSGCGTTDVNIAAGCNLLAKYEDDWKAIHDVNEDNGKKAANVAQLIDTIQHRSNKHRIEYMDFVSCLSTLPAVIKKLNETVEVLQAIEVLSESAEKKVDQLENLCEECDFMDFKARKEHEFMEYKKRKMEELEVYRQKLAAEKLRWDEARLQAVQRERQAVFENAFRDDVAEFKEKGTLAKLQTKENITQLTLEDIDLTDIEPQDALENFLNG